MDFLQEFFKLLGELRTLVISDFSWEAISQGEEFEHLSDCFAFFILVDHLNKYVARHPVHHKEIIVSFPAKLIEAY